jgi:hypothetical protein
MHLQWHGYGKFDIVSVNDISRPRIESSSLNFSRILLSNQGIRVASAPAPATIFESINIEGAVSALQANGIVLGPGSTVLQASWAASTDS